MLRLLMHLCLPVTTLYVEQAIGKAIDSCTSNDEDTAQSPSSIARGHLYISNVFHYGKSIRDQSTPWHNSN